MVEFAFLKTMHRKQAPLRVQMDKEQFVLFCERFRIGKAFFTTTQNFHAITNEAASISV